MNKQIAWFLVFLCLSSFVFAITWDNLKIDDIRIYNRTLSEQERYILHYGAFCIRGDLYILKSVNKTSGVYTLYYNQCGWKGQNDKDFSITYWYNNTN